VGLVVEINEAGRDLGVKGMLEGECDADVCFGVGVAGDFGFVSGPGRFEREFSGFEHQSAAFTSPIGIFGTRPRNHFQNISFWTMPSSPMIRESVVPVLIIAIAVELVDPAVDRAEVDTGPRPTRRIRA
jgi:hypothetical protein